MEAQPSGPPAPAAAWQPFTWCGVAAFSRPAPVMWLAWVFGTALLVGTAVERFVTLGWLPAVDAAVVSLPATANLARGRLNWPSNAVVELGKTPFLALRVNLLSTPVPGHAADVEVEASAGELTARSLFGYWILPYPASLELDLGRATVEPLWATWRPYVRVGVLVFAAAAVSLSWFALAAFAAPALRLLAAILRRDVTLGGCWRLAVVGMLPGALVVAAGLTLHASGGFRLIDFVFAFLIGHGIDVVLLAGAPRCLPRRVSVPLFGTPVTEVPAAQPLGEPEFQTPELTDPASSELRASPFVAPVPEPAVVPGNPFAVGRTPAEAAEPPRPVPPARPAPPPPPEWSGDQPLNPS